MWELKIMFGQQIKLKWDDYLLRIEVINIYYSPNMFTKYERVKPFSEKTSKFDQMPDDIRIENISRLFEQHGPHVEFDSKLFNYYMPKVNSM